MTKSIYIYIYIKVYIKKEIKFTINFERWCMTNNGIIPNALY